MSELQAGMLALVVGCGRVEQNIGKIVTLDRFVKKGSPAIEGIAIHDCWVIKGSEVGYTLGGEFVFGEYGLSRPCHLLPIKPEADPLDVTETQELHA